MSPLAFSKLRKLGATLILILPACAQTPSLEDQLVRGKELEARGEFAQAEKIFAAVLDETARLQLGPLITATALDCMASVYGDQARYADAERALLRALSLVEHAFGPDSRAAGAVLWHLSGIYGEAGRLNAAAPLLRRYETIVLATAAADPRAAIHDLGNLGRIYAVRRDPKKALALFQQSLQILEQSSSADDFDMTWALLDRASGFQKLGETGKAVADIERAAALMARFPHSYPAFQIDYGMRAGVIYAQAHRAADSDLAFQQAIEVAESVYGLTHPVLALVLRNYSEALHLQGKKKESSAAAARAHRIYAANGRNNPLGQAVDVRALR